jgi:hypothetical protein
MLSGVGSQLERGRSVTRRRTWNGAHSLVSKADAAAVLAVEDLHLVGLLLIPLMFQRDSNGSVRPISCFSRSTSDR